MPKLPAHSNKTLSVPDTYLVESVACGSEWVSISHLFCPYAPCLFSIIEVWEGERIKKINPSTVKTWLQQTSFYFGTKVFPLFYYLSRRMHLQYVWGQIKTGLPYCVFALCSSDVARCWCPKPAILGFIGCILFQDSLQRQLFYRFFLFVLFCPTCTCQCRSVSLCIMKFVHTKETVCWFIGVVHYSDRYMWLLWLWVSSILSVWKRVDAAAGL